MNSKNTFDTDTVLAALAQAPAAGMKIDDLAAHLGLAADERVRLRRVLARLAEQGAVARIGRGSYGVTSGLPTGKARKTPETSATPDEASSRKTGRKPDTKTDTKIDTKTNKKAARKADRTPDEAAAKKAAKAPDEAAAKKAAKKPARKPAKQTAEKTGQKPGKAAAQKPEEKPGKKIATAPRKATAVPEHIEPELTKP